MYILILLIFTVILAVILAVYLFDGFLYHITQSVRTGNTYAAVKYSSLYLGGVLLLLGMSSLALVKIS
jgi:hypothetical protein